MTASPLSFRSLLSVTLCSGLLLSACSPTVATRGNLLEPAQTQKIKPGVSTRDDVLHILGSPTAQAPFDANTWYYMGQKTEKRGVLDPKITQERVVRVRFDAEGKVAAIGDVRSGRENVPIVDRTTPTSGNEMTILQQFFGNLGKFNTPQDNGPIR